MSNVVVPSTFRRILVNKISHKFKEATSIERVDCPKLKQHEMLVRNRYIGINASDVNFSAGRFVSDYEFCVELLCVVHLLTNVASICVQV